MANQQPQQQPAPDLVEVRVTSLSYRREEDGRIVDHRRGSVIKLPRQEYDATCEIRDGVRRPSHAFVLVESEKAAAEKKVTERKYKDDRFMEMRQAAIDSQEASERARARQRVMEAENAQKLAGALKPLDRPGAIRHG